MINTGRPSKEREVKRRIVEVLAMEREPLGIPSICRKMAELPTPSTADYNTVRKYIKQLLLTNTVESSTLTQTKNGKLWVLYKLKNIEIGHREGSPTGNFQSPV